MYASIFIHSRKKKMNICGQVKCVLNLEWDSIINYIQTDKEAAVRENDSFAKKVIIIF